MFEKTLADLVKGIRAHKNTEDVYIRRAISEIQTELKSSDIKKKANAVQKLTYLHMFGYDMHWAVFHVIEVMTQPQFHYKRTGYLAASLAFTQNTDVIMLTTQLFRKDLNSRDPYTVGIALSCLAKIATPELARDLISDVVALLGSQRPYVRKKAVLILYKLFLKYPDALRPTFAQLKEKLADSHPSVVASAVNVICELARRNPQNYLGMAPIFYKLITSLNNNWTLIKIVKLFGALAPLEPRLAKKLVDPIANIINTTQAKSLLYECLNTATIGMKSRKSIIGVSVEKLKMFVESPDQNLKYLGLLGLGNLLDKYPLVIAELKDVILDCLEDDDITIRYRAVDLLCGVIGKKNVRNIVHRLMKQIKSSQTDYKNYLIERIIGACSMDNYANISNFKWYLQVLVEMTEVKGIEHGKLIASQMMDVMIRVKSIRSYGVSEMVKLLNAPFILGESTTTSNLFEVLYAASWTVGEFIGESEEDHRHVIESLLKDTCTTLPTRIQTCYIQAIMKVYSSAVSAALADKTEGSVDGELAVIDAALNNDTREHRLQRLAELRTMTLEGVEKMWGESSDVEIQERAFTCQKLLELHDELLHEALGATDIGQEMASLFMDELNPVAPGSQEKVPIPEGLDLDNWIGTPFSATFEEFDEDYKAPEDENEESDSGDEAALAELGKKKASVDRSLFYIKDKGRVDNNIKIHDISTLLGNDVDKKNKKKKPKKKSERKRRAKKDIDDEEHEVAITGFEAPEGYIPTTQKDVKPTYDPLNVDLSQPADEDLYRPQAYPTGEETLKKANEEIERQKRIKGERRKKDKETVEKKTKKKSKGKKSAVGEEEKKKKKKRSKKQEDGKEMSDNGGESSLLNLQLEEEEKPITTTAPKRGKKPKKGPRKKLCNDSNLKIAYNNNVMPTSESEINIPFIFENVAKEDKIIGISILLDHSTEAKLVNQKSEEKSIDDDDDDDDDEEQQQDNANGDIKKSDGMGIIRIDFELSPGEYNTASVEISFESVVRPILLSGRVEYKLSSNTDEHHSIPFNLVLPCSMFIQPKEILMEELGELIKKDKVPHLSSTLIEFPETDDVSKIKDVDTVATELSRVMRMAVVDYAEGIAYTLYGVSVQGHHVAALIKQTDKLNSIQLQIKCSDDVLGNNLLLEVDKQARK